MLSPKEIARYQRQIDLAPIGIKGQEQFKNSSILVIGAGGLGCPAIQYLVAAGVGSIGIIDHDAVEESNLQRQILYNDQDIGKNKALCAKANIQKHNLLVEIVSYPIQFTANNAFELCKQYDIIIDGTDNFETKYLINDATLLTGKPMVYASIYKFEGQLSVFNYQEGPSYRCLFPRHHQMDPNNCVDTGVLGVLPGVLGTLQAAEALKIILGAGHVLSGKMKVINLLTLDDQIVEFSRNEAVIQQIREQGLEKVSIDASLEKLMKDSVYVDIRESHEMPKIDRLHPLMIPMSQLEKRFKEIPKDKEVIIFCQTGKRSAEAVVYLKKQHGYQNIHSLSNGIRELQKLK